MKLTVRVDGQSYESVTNVNEEEFYDALGKAMDNRNGAVFNLPDGTRLWLGNEAVRRAHVILFPPFSQDKQD